MGLRIAATAAVFLFSTSVFSAVTVTVPEEIKIVAVNDQEVNSGLLRSNQTYSLDAGINAISVRYNEFFQHSDNSHDILKSGVVTVKTPSLKDGETYRLALIQAPKDFDAAQKYKDQPIIGLYDAKNQLLVQQTGAKDAAKPWFGNRVLTKKVDLTTQAATEVNQPAAIYTQSAEQNDQQLIQLWQKASKAERQKFMTWLAEQAN
ncbi:DUF2057 family protein [Acinetobacter lwoffii]|jgi:uncharacterized protein YccT (UPF0319 family)|uniref:DUF2057 domain-containing protein n=1 Tax=Acinetobacter lwoffii NCTC 5866 = CIP 64.10 = NIPH 512 TaxID=981327 RepID=A0ABP2ZFP1_ACILW|nr:MULTISPECIES: DUF2057 family protein [Acinetobacter]RDC51558.1 DUF2057 domain-containing protein [Acinetobacter sp. RIT592]ENU16883.1 hypothetical protein F995_00503 [Acinetobacter sp. CIP A162]ESJ96319.1 hypothetical protein P800_01143 [Acinetobacter lwoffii NCTC 5866 = CIP 64.10 = NIPH 512]QXB40200.1 DUF2057 domain-containing protein [Acinetobacter lwoffii]SUU29372.1 putative signal peptide-containing protein [Acinetobacter lwoffii]